MRALYAFLVGSSIFFNSYSVLAEHAPVHVSQDKLEHVNHFILHVGKNGERIRDDLRGGFTDVTVDENGLITSMKFALEKFDGNNDPLILDALKYEIKFNFDFNEKMTLSVSLDFPYKDVKKILYSLDSFSIDEWQSLQGMLKNRGFDVKSDIQFTDEKAFSLNINLSQGQFQSDVIKDFYANLTVNSEAEVIAGTGSFDLNEKNVLLNDFRSEGSKFFHILGDQKEPMEADIEKFNDSILVLGLQILKEILGDT